MSALSPDQQETARKISSTILRRLSSVGQVRVAEALGKSETTISRWKESGKEIDETGVFLAALGLKAVEIQIEFFS